MIANEQADSHDVITWHDGRASFRGFPVEQRTINVAGMSLRIASMRDATHLLDEPDCAKRFLEADMAPYGVELWPAALMLAEYIARDYAGPHRALEIGCGLGLVSLVAARLGWSVVAGDHEPTALVFARHNALLNDIPDIRFVELDWNVPPNANRFARILGADVLYQLNNHAPILNCLDRLLEPDGVALIADPNRGVADRFPAAAAAAGFRVVVLPAIAECLSEHPVEGRIFRVYRANSA
jgi:SAM-dependent methyltransferase